jgi:hypothetical protein
MSTKWIRTAEEVPLAVFLFETNAEFFEHRKIISVVPIKMWGAFQKTVRGSFKSVRFD